jgi:hypothetical protein
MVAVLFVVITVIQVRIAWECYSNRMIEEAWTMIEVNGLRQSDDPTQAVVCSSCPAEYRNPPELYVPIRINLWQGGTSRSTGSVGAFLRDSQIDQAVVGGSK